MTASKLYCAKCRLNYAHPVAAGKFDVDVFRRVAVTARNQDGSFACNCLGCGHTWRSKSQEAATIFGAGPNNSCMDSSVKQSLP